MEIHIPESDCDLHSYPPEAVHVRNTFIHVASPMAPDEMLLTVPAASCPARQIGKLRQTWQDEDSQSASSGSKFVICLEDSLFPTMPGTPEAFQLGCMDLTRKAADGLPEHVPLPPLEPAPGTKELPSLGSKGHSTGDCKPCAFMHAKGCKNGALCTFCHLCDRAEKKRRQKAKKALFMGA